MKARRRIALILPLLLLLIGCNPTENSKKTKQNIKNGGEY